MDVWQRKYTSVVPVLLSLSQHTHTEGPAGMELNVGSAPARTSILSHIGLTLTDSGSEPPLVSDVTLEILRGLICAHVYVYTTYM